ncbi:MAG TPA: glycosyltransferase family 2 protein [Polyangiaceae bacterium]|nr:glycosyltransferase family 2 protein [Polyangiaceae bacterium]
MRRRLAVIPAWNEAANIAHVIAELRTLSEAPDVLVIDDGSLDGTARIAREAGASVLRLPFNCGIGATVQAGIAWGLEREYRAMVRLDGDGQHDPASVASLVAPIEAGEADFVLGSRYLEREGFQSTWARRLGSRWFSFMLRVVSGLTITDPTSGCWAGNARALAVLHAEYASDYPEVDSLVRLQRAGCRIAERPVRMRPRGEGESSINAIGAVYYMLKVTIALLIGRVDRAPKKQGAQSDEA